jgi:hypothetical protein
VRVLVLDCNTYNWYYCVCASTTITKSNPTNDGNNLQLLPSTALHLQLVSHAYLRVVLLLHVDEEVHALDVEVLDILAVQVGLLLLGMRGRVRVWVCVCGCVRCVSMEGAGGGCACVCV